MMRPLLITAIVAALVPGLAQGTTAHARANNEVSIRMSNSFVIDTGYFAFSEDQLLVQAELSYARRIVDLGPGALWLEASWTGASVSSDVFDGAFTAKAVLHSTTVGARFALPLWSWFAPHARLGVGLALGEATLSTGQSSAGASDAPTDAFGTAAAFAGYALAGASILVPPRWFGSGFTAGVSLEGGMSFSTDLIFAPGPEQDADLRNIPLTSASLGALNLTGPVIRVGFVARF